MDFFSNPSAIYTKWCTQTFPPKFWTAISRTLWRHLPTKMRTMLVRLKAKSILEKRRKHCRNWHINGNTMPVRTIHPSNARCSGLGERDQKNKHHLFAPTSGAHCAIFPKLCVVIELVETIEKGDIHFFLIQRIVFPTGCTEKFGLIYQRAVSLQ